MPNYGNALGGYVQELGHGRVRISDNADTLFEAISCGVEHSPSRVEKILMLAKNFDVTVSDAGEIAVACTESELPYYFTRFIEALFAIGSATLDWHPKTHHLFRKNVGQILVRRFGNRIVNGFKTTGGSGHQLSFHFLMDELASRPCVIHTVAAQDGNADWNGVYGTLGKMIDLKNSGNNFRRLVVIEPCRTDELAKASTALAETADVIALSSESILIKSLAA